MNYAVIREATVADARKIAQVHINSWRETYAGLVSAKFLQNLSVDDRTSKWEAGFTEAQRPWKVFVVEEGSAIKGFINFGKSRKPEFVYNGEIYALYLLKEMQGRGLGKALFQKALGSFREEGAGSMFLWILKGNPTIDFYRHLGGREVAQQPLTIGGEEIGEIAMAWDRI